MLNESNGILIIIPLSKEPSPKTVYGTLVFEKYALSATPLWNALVAEKVAPRSPARY
jgi:hypothetical protein